MSNFACETCGTVCVDSPSGYLTGCEHYPAYRQGPRINSPNWGWEKLGYSIERHGTAKLHRTIRDKAGNVVLHMPTYEDEVRWLTENGVLSPNAKLSRLAP